MSANLCVLYDSELNAYSFGPPHVFGPDRLPAFWKEFQARGLHQRVAIEASEICSEEELTAFHTPEYVHFVKQASARGDGYLDYGDTPAFPGVFEAASRVVGTTLKALRLIMEGKYTRAFCPLGGLHHARRGHAGGFCVFNDIGVVIEHLKSSCGIQRIGYVDIDAHHGDGVFYPYESDPQVFIADIHQDGRFFYPFSGFAHETGSGPAKDTKLNLPMNLHAGDDDFMQAFRKVEDFLHACRPEIIIFQSGADSVAGDDLADLRFSAKCHAYAAHRLSVIAEQYAEKRLLVMGGGGYSLPNLARTWCGVVEALLAES